MELINYEAVNIKYYKCVCIIAFVIQHENRIFQRRNKLSPVACLILPFVSTLYYERARFSEKNQNKIFVLIFSANLPEIFLILRTLRNIIINLRWSSFKIPVILVIF
jgi:hypothetical protein